MTIESGTRVQNAYIAETTHGTTPTTPTLKIQRATERVINLKKNILESDEVRADREISDVRHGFNHDDGNIGFQLGIVDYDDWLSYALAGSWAAVTTGTATLSTDAATNAITRATGSFVTDGFRAGDIVVTTGFTTAANNRTSRVLSVAALSLVIDFDITVSDTGSGDEVVALTGKRLDIGTTLTTMTVEQQMLGITKYRPFRGVAINTLSLAVQPERMVTGAFGLIGMSASAFSGSSVSASPATAVSTNSPFAAFDGEVYEGGTIIAIMTGLNLALANGRILSPVIGSKFSPDVFEGRARVTGDATLFFQDSTMYDKFVNETSSSIWCKLADPAGNFHNLVMNNVKYTGGDITPPQEGPVPLAMPFSALIGTLPSLSIQRSNS
jgi:hypothetical protein